MDVIDWAKALDDSGNALVTAARTAGLDAEVPSCPGWRVRDLVLHTGGVHRWATTFVTTGRTEPLHYAEPQHIVDIPPDDATLLTWFAEGAESLATALRTAPPDLTCWTFLAAPSPLAHWARRQAHETTVHRIDAETAAGTASPVDPTLAADGIDELLGCFGVRSRKLRREPAHSLVVHAVDTGDHWTMRLHAERPVLTRTRVEAASSAASPGTDPAGAASTVLRGTAEELYRALWNRAPLPPLHAAGEAGLVTDWPTLLRVRWS